MIILLEKDMVPNLGPFLLKISLHLVVVLI